MQRLPEMMQFVYESKTVLLNINNIFFKLLCILKIDNIYKIFYKIKSAHVDKDKLVETVYVRNGTSDLQQNERVIFRKTSNCV